MEKVSLQSKSNTSLDPSSYPKDLDPFGEEDDESQLGQTIHSSEVIKPSAPVDPSYPGTLDPFAEENDGEDKGKESCQGVKSINKSNRSSKRISYQEKDPNNVTTNSNGGVSLETSITSRASDYDESLDPFGDDEAITVVKTKADDRKSIVDTSRELRKPAIVLGEPSTGGNRVITHDNLSIKSETESSSGETMRKGGEERNSYSNQNSPVPVPPRRKHRNVSPSTKSLNRASYSASSLEREPTNGISSPSSPDPNRLSTVETDSYLSHSTSNLSIRSTSPITTVRSSPIRSRKKRRAPDPPGFPPTAPSTVTSPTTLNNSLASTDADTSMETTIGSIKETSSDTLNEPKDEATNEIPLEATPAPTPEPKSEPCTEPTEESNNETPIEPNSEIETEREKEKEKPTDEPTPTTSSEATSDKAKEPESQTYSSTLSDSTADSTEKLDPDQSKSHQDPSNL